MDEENEQILLKERYKLLEWTSSVELRTPNLLIPVQIANYVESLPFCKFAVSPKCDRIALMSYTRILDIYLLNGEILDHESSVQILEENSPEYCILQFTSSGQLLLSSRSTPHIDIFDSMGAYCYDIPLEPHEPGIFDVICAMQTVSLGTSADKYSEILYVLQYSGTFSAFKISRLSKYTKLWAISLEIGAVGTFQILPKYNLLLVSSHSNDTKNPGLCSFRMLDSYPYVEPIKISSTSTDSTWFFTWKLPFSTSSISFLPKMSVGEQFMISVSTSGSLFLFEIPSTRLKFAFNYINGPRPVEACFVDLDEIAIIYDNGVLLRCTIDEIEEKMFSMKIRTPEDLEDIYPGQTMLQTPAHREIFLLSAEGDSSIFREAAHKRVQLAGQLWFYTVWNSLKKLCGMAMGESAEPLQMATHLARFEFAIHHSPTRTLQQLFDRTLIEHDYTRARELATSYDTIDIDIVLKSEWLEKSAQNLVKITDVSEILAQIRDLQWVLEQCINVNSESFEVQKALIELGLEIQEEDQDQLLHHQRILEVCNSDLEIYLRIRNRSILEAAIYFANCSDFELLYRIIEKNQECLRKHQRKILSAIPSCVYPTKYEHFLPKKHGEQWEIDLLQDHHQEKRNTSIWNAEGVAEDAEGWDFIEWIHETTRKIDFECGIIANSIGLLRLCAERGWHAELREEIEKWELYAEYTRICASIAESLASFEKASVEDFVGRFGMLLESELINNAFSIINLIEYKISQDPESEKISKIEKTMTNLMCQTNEKSTKVLAEFRRIRPDLISDRVVLECLMNMTTTGGDLLGNLTDFEGFLDYENITSALNSLMSRGVKMTFKAIFESMKEPQRTMNDHFCTYCGLKGKYFEMKAVTTSKKQLEKWIEKLGVDFAKNVRMYGRPYICRSHFVRDSFGRVPALALPKPLPFSSNFAENVVMTNSTSKSDKEIAVAPTSKSDKEEAVAPTSTSYKEEADVSEVVEIQEKTDDDEDLSNLSDESGYDLIQQQVEAVKDPNYQPSTSEYRQILDDESFDNDFDQTVDEKESDIDFVLVSFQLLLPLILKCYSCFSIANYKLSKFGAVLTFDCTCECSRTWRWSTSQKVKKNDNTSSKRFELNVSLTTAAVTIGLSYSNIMSIFSVVKAPFISKTTFYETRRLGVVPAINKVFMEQRQKIIKILKQINIPIDAAGDGMYDSRGYCAFWCRYIIICTLTKFVLHYKNVRKTAGKGSKGLEPIAQSQCLSELVDMLKETFVNVDPIRSLTTDRDLAVAANMKNQFPKIIHRFDLWHLIRNLTMDIWPKKDQKQMIPIKPWIQAIINNVYSSIQNSGGDPIIARELVMSSFAHCLDQHSNFQNITWYKFTKVNQCRHSPTSTSHVGFLNPNNVKDMKAWEALRKIFVKGNRLNDIGQISAHFMTSECESFNALSKKYAPKDKYFSSHETTTRLAVLHWNHLKIEELEGRRTVIGGKSSMNKTKQQKRVKKMKSPSDHSWRIEIKNAALSIFGEELSKKSNNLQEEEKEESSDEEFSLENLTDKDYFEKRQVFDEFESSSEKSESDSDAEESDEPDEAD